MKKFYFRVAFLKATTSVFDKSTAQVKPFCFASEVDGTV
jgi:hypothetical protein